MSKIDTKITSFTAPSDVISLRNMTSGFMASICSLNDNFELAGILMILAIVFDSADGWVARKTNRQDDLGFGKNIDSLSDIVSFGLTPAIFLYCLTTPTGLNHIIVIAVCLMIVICGILRLARYNVLADKLDTGDFIGFPIPGISFILATFYLSGIYNPVIGLILSIIVSLLMISNIKYPKFDNTLIIGFSAVLIVLLIIPVNITLYTINIPAVLLLVFCLSYLTVNLIKR